MSRSSGGCGGMGFNRGFNWQKAEKMNRAATISARETDTVSWMIHNVQKHSQLSHEESTALFQQYEKGGAEAKAAKNRLVEANLKLVIMVAKGYRRSGLDFEDILQEGNMGLIRAVEKFKWEKGYRFSTYATWWIRQAISQFVQKRSRTVRLPAHAIGISRRMEGVKAEYKKEFGVEPSIEELSALMDVSETLVKATVHGAKRTVSLSTPLDRDGEGGDELGDTIVDTTPGNNPFEAFAEKEVAELFRRSFAKLSPREEQILRLRYGISDVDSDPQFQMSEEEAAAVAARAK